MNPHLINREHILDCNGEMLDVFENSLDDHKKLIEILEDQDNFYKLHFIKILL